MFIDLWNSLFTSSAVEGVPNHAELESAHAAWASAIITLLTGIATVAAVWWAALSYKAQSKAFGADLRARQVDRHDRAAEAADMVGINLISAEDWEERAVVPFAPPPGDGRKVLKFQIINGGNGWLRDFEMHHAGTNASVMRGTQQRHVEGHLQVGKPWALPALAPGAAAEFVVFTALTPEADEEQIGKGPRFRWTDVQNNRWEGRRGVGISLIRKAPSPYSSDS